MKKFKAICFAYPTSERASELNVYNTGGYFIEGSHINEDGHRSVPYVWPGTEGEVFQDANDPALLDLFEELDAEICYWMLRCLHEGFSNNFSDETVARLKSLPHNYYGIPQGSSVETPKGQNNAHH